MGKERDYIIHNDHEIKGFFGEYRFLSNFEVAGVYFEGVLYPSTEHAYQAAKSLDPEIRKQFLNITCAEAKNLGNGKKLKNHPDLMSIILREDWESVKFDIMFSVCFDKFYRHSNLRQKLLDTGKRYLEETNHWGDRIYGVCDGEGKNMLGQILMKIREIIRFTSNYSGISLNFM